MRLGQRPQVGRVALLSAGVTAFKPHHYKRPDESPALFYCWIPHCLGVKNKLQIQVMKHRLDFEKPIIELQNKLDDLRQHPEKHSLGISFEEEIQLIEKKLEETRRHIFSNLTPWQRVQLARHPNRPYTLDYLKKIFTGFSELHGDRLFAEDHAMVGGFAQL